MANELEQLTINEAGTSWVDSSPSAASTGYQAQNTNITARTVGQDLTDAYVSGDDVIVNISGPVDLDGIPFSLTTAVTLTPEDEDDGAGTYYIRIIDGSATTTKSLELTTDEITWSATKNAYYDTDGNRVLNWKVDYNNEGSGVTLVRMVHAGDGNVEVAGLGSFGGNVSGDTILGDISSRSPVTITQEGSTFSLGVSNPALAALSNTRVALLDASNDSLRTYEFDGTDWALVGNGLSISVGTPALAALSKNRVAMIANGDDYLRTYEFDGTDWAQVGNSTAQGVGNPAICALTDTRIALIDSDNNNLVAYDFDETNWSIVGSALSITAADHYSIAAISSRRIRLCNSSDSTVKTYGFTGSTWVELLSATSTVTGESGITTLLDNAYAVADGSSGTITLFLGDGSEIKLSKATGTPAITAMGKDRIAFIGSFSDTLTAYRLGYEEFPPSPVFDIY